jgi:hypothetical protein
MTETVVFLGAGATKSVDGPLTNEILKQMLYPDPNQYTTRVPPPLLREFLEQLFHVNSTTPIEQFPGLPLLMSLIDTALDREEQFHPDWNTTRISELRQAVEIGMFELIEEALRKAPTQYHFQLLDKLFPSPAEPCIITTNYDVVIDTAMMYFSEKRVPSGVLPDYRVRFGTPDRDTRRFGTLLKLHGSLNWVHCRNCRRMEIGTSASTLYIKVVQRLAYEVRDFTAVGSRCPSCSYPLVPLLIAPTHLKDYRNPHLTMIWHEAERVLRKADRIIFIGYSLPDDDVEVVYLLKRNLASLPPDKITVVEYDQNRPAVENHSAGRRYRALFGDGIDWHPEGLDEWLRQL